MKNISREDAVLAANTIRILAAEGVEKAKSGHPGMPMGMADCALVLWTRFLNHFPKDPDWAGRDRFVLSAGHGSMLLYSLLYLSGYDVTLDDLKSFRQWGSRTPGHPEHGLLPGVETTTGPLGQGFANGVGMAIAAKMSAARYNTSDHTLFGTHRIYGIVSDGDLMEGVSSEAASIAGHLGLGNIVYFYDDNKITIEGKTELTFSENVAQRFEAYGWHTVTIDGHNHDQIESALHAGIEETGKPTLIIARTHIGFGSPNKRDTAGVHGAPLGAEELALTRQNLDWQENTEFSVPGCVNKIFRDREREMQEEYTTWQQEFKNWQAANPELAQARKSAMAREIPENINSILLNAVPMDAAATRSLSGKLMQQIAGLLPNFVGGSADLAPSTNTYLKGSPDIAPSAFDGRNFHFGIREHGMGGILNGIALYGGFIPFGATFFVFSDYMRASVRLAAIMELPVIYVFTHDSIFVGEDGPTHEPVEHLAALRTIPGPTVLRPADGLEVAMSWSYALKNRTGPTALILTRQKVDPLSRGGDFDPELVNRGAYVISRESGVRPEIVILASGSEVQVAMESQKLLENEGKSVRVVSVPCRELFMRQSPEYRQSVLGLSGSKYVVVEAGVAQGWGDLLLQPYLMIGMNRFGASAPYKILAEKFGFTGEQVSVKIKKWLDGGTTE